MNATFLQYVMFTSDVISYFLEIIVLEYQKYVFRTIIRSHFRNISDFDIQLYV